MNLQGMFDVVWNHYIVDNKPLGVRAMATNGGGVRWISYYGLPSSTNKDPVTLFDDYGVLYGKSGSLQAIQEQYPELVEQIAKNFPARGLDLLIELQIAHDNVVLHYYSRAPSKCRAKLAEQLQRVARLFGLVEPTYTPRVQE